MILNFDTDGNIVMDQLQRISDLGLLQLRTAIEGEMRKRKLAFSVGEVGERLAIHHFKTTPGLPKLQLAPPGTKNVDALSRDGDRYSIKTQLNAKKTGTIYPDSEDKGKQLFEFLLIVRLDVDWSLQAVYQFAWSEFVEIRSWDKRMNAWYVGCSATTLKRATLIFASERDLLTRV